MRGKLLALSMMLLPVAVWAGDDRPAQGALETRTIKIPYSTATYGLVKIPGGAIEVAGKKVEVKPIWVGRTEITWDCFDPWSMAMDLRPDARDRATARPAEGGTRPSRPYNPPDRGFGHEGYPAICMSYESAGDYCAWLSDKLKLKIRLPTEAEFMCAAQAGLGREPASDELEKLAWFKANSDRKTHAVAQKSPNAWGLYDLYGNAGEWVRKPEPEGDLKFVKGGSFKDPAKLLNSAARKPWTPDWQNRDPEDPKSKWWMSDGEFVGFRIVTEITNDKDKQ